MRDNPKSVIDEISSFIPEKHKDRVIETRAVNLIGAAVNVIELFEEAYSPEEAEELTKKFLLAIRARESKKFTNKLRTLSESKKKSKTGKKL